jgi:hypothetical protein
MMRAIAHSMPDGIELAYSDRLGGNQEYEGYRPNPWGLYELGGMSRTSQGMRELNARHQALRKRPASIVHGCGVVVKILFDALPNLPKGQHKIIFMVRDPVEIMASVRRVQAHFDKVGHEQPQPYPINVRTFDVYRNYSQADIDHVLGILDVRCDVEYIVVDFKDLIENPEIEFERAAELLHPIPLNAKRAATFIDPKLYRERKDDNREVVANRASTEADHRQGEGVRVGGS